MAADSAWGGRFKEKTAAVVEAMNASVGFDQALAIEDIAGSIAQSRMLLAQGILNDAEQTQLEAGLVAIAADIRAGGFAWTIAREDVHMNVEGALADRLGPVAGKLHSGRSRNDQVALDLKLWLRRQLTELSAGLVRLISTLIARADGHRNTAMPGYTHLQRAQPITFGHHLTAYVAMFLRDLDRVLDTRRRAAVMPLGSGALAASPLPLDRERVARELGYDQITLNSLDGVSDRDHGIETLSALAIIIMHISRLSEELVLWCSQEFGFVTLSDGFCTGSSLMPQKKNPDIPELLRGKTGRVFGALQALLVVMKGLPLAYNKDMQEDKEPLFDAMKTVREAVEILPELLGAMTVNEDRMRAALKDGFVLATDLADYLVDKGVPFRDAHHVVGRVVASCLDRGCRLEDLETKDLQALHPAFDDDIHAVLTPDHSLSRRAIPGGPAPSAVKQALQLALARLDELEAQIAMGGPSAIEQALATGSPLPAPVA